MSADAIQLEQWNLQYHELMAAILRASATIKREVSIFGIAPRLWGVARDLKNIVPLQKHLYGLMLELPDGTIDDAIIRDSVKSTGDLVRSIEGLLDTAKRRGLMNRTLTAASLETIRRHGEEIAEHLDVLRLSIDPEAEGLIREGREDFAAGRGVPLDSLLQ